MSSLVFFKTEKCHNKSKEEGKDQESIQSSTYLTPYTIWISGKNTRKHHTQENQEVSPFPAGDHKAAKNRQDTKSKDKHETQIHKRK